MPDVNIARDPGHTGAAPVDSPPASRRQRTPQVHIRPDWNRTFRSRSIEVSPPSTVAAMIPYTIGASTLKDTRRPSSSHPRGSAYTARAHGRFVAGKRFEAARRRARPPSCGWRVAAGGPADPGARPGPLRRLVDLGDRAGPVDGRHRRVRHDTAASGTGERFNVVIHEAVNGLDALDGGLNAQPPQHDGRVGALVHRRAFTRCATRATTWRWPPTPPTPLRSSSRSRASSSSSCRRPSPTSTPPYRRSSPLLRWRRCAATA